MVIDAHTHVFDKITGKTTEGEIRAERCGRVKCGAETVQVMPPSFFDSDDITSFNADMLAGFMDVEKIDRAMLLQGSFWGDQNAAAEAALKKYPDRFAAALYIEPWQNDAGEIIEKNAGLFSAVKLECSVSTGFSGIVPDFDLKDYMDLYKVMENNKMTLVLDLGTAGTKSYQTDEVREIIDECPDLTVVICHLAQPRQYYLEAQPLLKEWKEQIKLAKYGNVYFDTASLPVYFNNLPDKDEDIYYFFETAVDIAGADRIMAGTDFPGNSLVYTYGQMINIPAELGKQYGLDSSEIADIMGNTANNIYFNRNKN